MNGNTIQIHNCKLQSLPHSLCFFFFLFYRIFLEIQNEELYESFWLEDKHVSYSHRICVEVRLCFPKHSTSLFFVYFDVQSKLRCSISGFSYFFYFSILVILFRSSILVNSIFCFLQHLIAIEYSGFLGS